MQKKTDGFQEFSMEQAAALAENPAAKELLALLQRSNGDQLHAAMKQVSAGDYAEVKKTIQQMMASPQAQELLKKLQR